MEININQLKPAPGRCILELRQEEKVIVDLDNETSNFMKVIAVGEPAIVTFRPTFKVGDIVYMSQLSGRRLEIGDRTYIVTAQSNVDATVTDK